jgi:hypothetical protein
LPLAAVEGVDFVHCDPRWPEGARVALLEARRLGIPGMLDGTVGRLAPTCATGNPRRLLGCGPAYVHRVR